MSWAWWDWPLTWLTNHYPSVLWRCWLGRMTRRIVSKMTNNVSSGTLNSTTTYRLVEFMCDKCEMSNRFLKAFYSTVKCFFTLWILWAQVKHFSCQLIIYLNDCRISVIVSQLGELCSVCECGWWCCCWLDVSKLDQLELARKIISFQ